MSALAENTPDEKKVLTKAYVNAAKALGMNTTTAAQVIGINRTTLTRGLDPKQKNSELALMVIRCYRSLSALMGGNQDHMRHWFNTHNIHLNATPAQAILSVEGLYRITRYLDALRGKN